MAGPDFKADQGFGALAASRPGLRAAVWLKEAESVFETLGCASPLGTVVISLGLPRLERNSSLATAWGVALGSCLLGYAARIAEGADAVPDSDRLVSELPFTEAGDVDYAELSHDLAALDAVADEAAELAGDVDAFMGLTPTRDHRVWKHFAEDAAHRLRRHFLRRGVSGRAIPTPDVFARLLRFGYVVRVIDEGACEHPAARRTPEAEVGTPCTGDDAWVRDAGARCAEDFDPAMERLLERGALTVLGLRSTTELEHDQDIEALAAVRVGFAMRHLEAGWTVAAEPRDCAELVTEAERRCRSTPAPDEVAVALIDEVVRFGYFGGAEALIQRVSGEHAALRDGAFAIAAGRHGSVDAASEALSPTAGLLHFGYLLHWLFETQEDWVGPRTERDHGSR